LGTVLSFHSAVVARAEGAQAKLAFNGRTVEVAGGRVVAQHAPQKLTAGDRVAMARVDAAPQYYADAEADGVPVRVVQAAWTNYRAAIAEMQIPGLSLAWPSEAVRSCRALQLVIDGAKAGSFSILDGSQPRSAIAIRRDLAGLLESKG
jgi:hypothetical protein